jgi:hypothetical protein
MGSGVPQGKRLGSSKAEIAASFSAGKLKMAALQGGGADEDRPFPNGE